MIIPDRIEAGTFMVAGAAVSDNLLIDNVIPQHVEPLTAKLREIGADVQVGEDQVLVSRSRMPLKSADVKTLVYPGFPTDLQQPMTSLLTQAEGTSIITDTIYGARFKHIDELRRMGADVKVEGRSAILSGPTSLEGAKVRATDLRAGASLIIAGLMARGITEIVGVEHIDRGYDHIMEKLQGVGANIWREPMREEEARESLKEQE
ncbi:UDP-N-acetylglucosamine 1-carboxyvinyltransferase [Sporolactobacillus inulinus]|nr:UDP-N-acetylglucosamine 1-carboxyvinyltransferase [Sporolactobacillus inulinus]